MSNHWPRRPCWYVQSFPPVCQGWQGHRFDDGLQAIKTFQWQMAEIMTMLGAKNIAELRQKDLVLAPNVQNWCEARGIDWKAYARRSQLVK